MRLKRILQDYFTFSRKERNGIIVLLSIILILIIINQTLFLFETTSILDVSEFLEEVKRIESLNVSKEKNQSLFVFDPNIIDSVAIDSLDIPKLVKSNLLRYRNKGGSFNTNTDLKKLYGMNDSIYEILEPFITIEAKQSPKNNLIKFPSRKRVVHFSKFDANNCSDSLLLGFGLTKKQIATYRKYQKAIGAYSNKKQLGKLYGFPNQLKDSLIKYATIQSSIPKQEQIQLQFELNTVTPDELKKINGIGEVLSKRIIKYRNLLGGYYCVEQLKEVYGLPEELFQEIYRSFNVNSSLINSININFTSKDELIRHPYINAEIAEKIIKFRSENGKITNIDQLLAEIILNKEKTERLRPYLKTKIQ